MAAQLGCTVAELEDRISAKELSEWAEFYGLEPFGWEALCFSSGIVASTIANIHRDTKKRPKPFAAVEFVPGYKPPKKDPRETQANLRALFMGMKSRATKVRGDKHGPRLGQPAGAGEVPFGSGQDKDPHASSAANRGGSKKAGTKKNQRSRT